jgi:hypothetical protein
MTKQDDQETRSHGKLLIDAGLDLPCCGYKRVSEQLRAEIDGLRGHRTELKAQLAKAEQERDDALKREADPSTTSSAHCGEDETVAQMERFKVRARQEAMVIGNLYCLNGDAVYQVSQNILSAMVAAWVAGCISAAGER